MNIRRVSCFDDLSKAEYVYEGDEAVFVDARTSGGLARLPRRSSHCSLLHCPRCVEGILLEQNIKVSGFRLPHLREGLERAVGTGREDAGNSDEKFAVRLTDAHSC